MECSDKDPEKPLTIDKAAFLLLRVRRVFKKKLQLKKEKNGFAQEGILPKSADLSQINLSKLQKKKRIPHLIRSRTVPAIIVPFSILQAQITKNASSANYSPAPNTVHPSCQQDLNAKRGSHVSVASRDSICVESTDSPVLNISVTAPPPPSGNLLEPTCWSADSSTSSLGVPGAGSAGAYVSTPSSSGKPSLGRFARLLNSASEERRKSSVSLQHYHLQSHQPPPLNQHEFLSVWDTSSEGQSPIHRYESTTSYQQQQPPPSKSRKSFLNTPKLPRRRRSLEAEDLQRPRADSVDSFLKTHFLQPDGTSKSYAATKRLSTCSANQTKLDDHKYNQDLMRLLRRRRDEGAHNEDSEGHQKVRLAGGGGGGSSEHGTSEMRLCSLPHAASKSKELFLKNQDKRRVEKLNQINSNHDGLVIAVQEGNVDVVKSFLESSEPDINNLSIDGLSLLDVAVMQRNSTLVKLLLANGATERLVGNEFYGMQLDIIVQEAEKKSEDLMSRLLKCSTFGNLSAVQLKELEKEFHQWEKRFKKFRKMRDDYHQLKPPEPPSKVTVDVLGPSAVRIRFEDALDVPEEASICTKYKIEWSLDEDFPTGPPTKWIEMLDLRKLETVLGDLETGERYFFRVAAGNCKGYGPYRLSTPTSVIPSSWRDLDGRKSRYTGKAGVFDDILREIQKSRPEYASDHHNPAADRSTIQSSSTPCQCKSSGNSESNSGSTTPVNANNAILTSIASPSGGCNQPGCALKSLSTTTSASSSSSSASTSTKKNQKIISIKQLFAAAPKFQKHFKRGIFLSCIMYSGDKILVTTEEFLPTIEIDETPPSSLHNDFHWLLKVASTWEDIKSFKADMEKSRSASTFHFRLKLLQAAASMQNALGVTDLGRIFYKTIRDSGNSVVIITTINYLRSTKMISTLNVRWVPITKLGSRKSTDDVSDVLISSIQEQILYHQVSNIPVGRGLYLGYLKLASSMDLLKILVSDKTPNMLPHAKIRDNPYVSGEEWNFIQSLAKPKSTESVNNPSTTGSNSSIAKTNNDDEKDVAATDDPNKQPPYKKNKSWSSKAPLSEAQQLFQDQITVAMKRLFAILDIDAQAALSHRLYNAEVIEVSSSVSMIIVVPSVENVCLLAGQSDHMMQRSDLIPLPIQVFEMIHLNTYQKDFVARYARLSAILEMDTILAQHNQREAFSSMEMASAKERMNQLQDLQSKIDSTWKGSRWVIDVVTASRDKTLASASVQTLYEIEDSLRRSCESVYSIEDGTSAHRLAVFGSGADLAVPGSNMKFSKSENQLANINQGSTDSTESTPVHAPCTRKVSVPMQSTRADGSNAQDKLMFKPKIHTTHSQSDSTISQSYWPLNMPSSDQTSSLSLHNLHREASSNKIVSPNHYTSISPVSSTCSTITQVSPALPSVSPSSVSSIGKSQQQSPPISSRFRPSLPKSTTSGEPPPVPPRRSLPPAAAMSQGAYSPSIIAEGSPIDCRVFPNSFIESLSSPNSSPGKPSLSVRAVDPYAASGFDIQSSDRASSATSSSSSSLVYSQQSSSQSQLPEDSLSSLQAQTQSTSSPVTPSVDVVQVYAAYDSGLAAGTSIKLQITNQTTAKQVVNIFIKQLNAEVAAKGLSGPIYDKTQDFCLVTVVGARERCFRDDFKPLHIQEPWKQGRFYVRKKSNVTAAIDLHAAGGTSS